MEKTKGRKREIHIIDFMGSKVVIKWNPKTPLQKKLTDEKIIKLFCELF